jgi:hypothetical protein
MILLNYNRNELLLVQYVPILHLVYFFTTVSDSLWELDILSTAYVSPHNINVADLHNTPSSEQ